MKLGMGLRGGSGGTVLSPSTKPSERFISPGKQSLGGPTLQRGAGGQDLTF